MQRSPFSRFTVLLFAALFTFGAVERAVAENYIFAIPLFQGDSRGGAQKGKEGAGGNRESMMFTKICTIISKKTGDNMECKIIDKPIDATLTQKNIKKFISSLESTNYSAAYLSSNDYYNLVSSGYDKLRPAVVLTYFKKNYDEACIYTRESDGIKTLQDLRSRNWGGDYFYMATRYILYKNGIDEPLNKFFGKLTYIPDDTWTNHADNLLAKKIDAFTGAVGEESISRNRDQRYRVIKRQFCQKFRSTHMIAFNKSMSAEKMSQLRGILVNAHKDKDFQDFGMIFAAIQGHFVPFDEETFKITKEFIDTANQRGWLQEQLDFMGLKQ